MDSETGRHSTKGGNDITVEDVDLRPMNLHQVVNNLNLPDFGDNLIRI